MLLNMMLASPAWIAGQAVWLVCDRVVLAMERSRPRYLSPQGKPRRFEGGEDIGMLGIQRS